MKMRKCLSHKQPIYTLKNECPECGKDTVDAHYKFVRLGSAATENSEAQQQS